MALELMKTFASSAVSTGTSGTLTISVPPGYNRILVVAVVTDYTAGLGAQVSSMTYGGQSLGQVSTSTGCEIRALVDPAITPGLSTRNISVAFSSSRNWALAAYVCKSRITTGYSGQLGIDGNVTGDPVFSSAWALTAGSILFDGVMIEQNTIVANGTQVEVMNLTSGSGATLRSYASSYYNADDNLTATTGWTRQGSPVNDTWGMTAREIKCATTFPPRINPS